MQADIDAVFANNYCILITETKVLWEVIGLSQDESWTDFYETLGVNSLKRPIEWYHFQPISFVIGKYL